MIFDSDSLEEHSKIIVELFHSVTTVRLDLVDAESVHPCDKLCQHGLSDS